MEVLFVTGEVAPISGDGPAATVCAALPKALRGLGHRATVLSPLYSTVSPERLSLARRLTKVQVEVGGERHACEIYDGRTAGGIDLLFLGNEQLFHRADRLAPPGESPQTTALRVGLFARAAAEVLATREPRFEVAHVHDWPGAAAAVACRHHPLLSRLPVVLTLHDLQMQGVFDVEHAAAVGVADQAIAIDGGRINLLRAGITFADFVTAVSPTVAAELATDAGGHRLHDLLGTLGERFAGIPCGVDGSVWNPVTDAHLSARYDPMDQSGKLRCKGDLQHELALPVRTDIPLLGVLGTTAPAGGIDILVKAAARLLRNDAQLVVELDPEHPLAPVLRELSERFPDRLKLVAGSESMTHRLVAAADVILVPAPRAEAAYAQLYAHRYGALPVGRRTGAVADSVVDCDASLRTGTGFLFDGPTADELVAAAQRAIAAFTDREAFRALSRRVMRIDHSWERSARLYERLYKKLTAG